MILSEIFEYFWDRNQRLWILYPIDENKNRIEWDSNDNPIECQYFNNKKELKQFLNKNK
jgi:hypothetical protein